MLWFVANGHYIPVERMLDLDGDETDDPKMAAVVTGHLPDGKWLATECREGDLIKIRSH